MLKFQSEWLRYLSDVRGLSSHTRESYEMAVTKFSYWLAVLGPVDFDEASLTAVQCNEFLAWCKSSGLCAKSCNVVRCGLRSYFDYCWRYCGYSSNPVAETEAMKEPFLLPQYIQSDEISAVLNSLTGDDFVSVRAKAIVLILCHCGLRCSELANLKKSDIRGSSMIIYGKGCKQRLVPMSADVISALELMSAAAEKAGITSSFVFCRVDGRQLSRSVIYKIIHRLFVNVCPPELAHPHALRHSFATICCLHGIPIPTIQGLLGHQTPATTFKYLSVANNSSNPFDTFSL